MNRTLHTFGTSDAASAILRGGRAPRYWRRECARVASRRVALERVARWGADVYARAPGLSETTLWGERLAELTAPTPARDADDDTRRSSRPSEGRAFSNGGTDARTRRTSDKVAHPARHLSGARGLPPPPLSQSPSQSSEQRAAHASTYAPNLADTDASTLINSPGMKANAHPESHFYAAHPVAQSKDEESRAAHQPSAQGRLTSSESLSDAASVATFVNDVESLPREVGGELLHRLAGRNGSSPDALRNTAHTPQHQTREQHPARPHARTGGTRFRPPPSSQASAVPDAPHLVRTRLPDLGGRAREDEWRSLLAARAALSLRRAVVSANAPAQMKEPLIAHQLSLPVAGETAPLDLLTRFSDTRSRLSGARRSPTPQPQRERATSQSSTVNASPDAATRLPHETMTSLSKARHEAPVSPVQFRGIEVESKQSRETATASVLPGEVAAPVPAESLPSLLPPTFVGVPVLPIALATAREGTRSEAHETAEDLDALAEKIKLILDEQARRHGIDV